MPTDFALFTREMPAANSGAKRPLSAASAASFRMADIRTIIDEEPSFRASSDARQALTVALVKPGRGSCWNHARNSSRAMLYTRFVIGEETLSRTSVFNFSQPAIRCFTTNSVILGPRCWALTDTWTLALRQGNIKWMESMAACELLAGRDNERQMAAGCI